MYPRCLLHVLQGAIKIICITDHRKKELTMDNIQVNGITMTYQDQGEGEVIVLLHGFCGSSYYWEKVQPILAQHYRVICPDLRGHGSTGAPVGAYTIEQMADDVAGLMEQLGITKYIVLGHSMGGYVTLSLVQRYGHVLSGFGLIHSTGHSDSAEAMEKRLASVASINANGMTAFVDGFVSGLFAPSQLEQHNEVLVRVKEIAYKTPPQGAIGSLMAMRERTARCDVMSASVLPLLLVAGDEDPILTVERVFTTDREGVTQVIVDGTGHMSMFEAPEQLAKIIKQFADSIHNV